MNTKKRFLSTYVSLETIPHIELSLELFGLGVGSVFNMQGSTQISLREKCPYSEFFRSVFSRIRTEYGEIRSVSPYSVQMPEDTDQKNSEYGHFSRTAFGC